MNFKIDISNYRTIFVACCQWHGSVLLGRRCDVLPILWMTSLFREVASHRHFELYDNSYSPQKAATTNMEEEKALTDF